MCVCELGEVYKINYSYGEVFDSGELKMKLVYSISSAMQEKSESHQVQVNYLSWDIFILGSVLKSTFQHTLYNL